MTVVHHDLATVRERFGWAVLLGLGTVTAGPPDTVLTPERLLAAYGATRAMASGPACDDVHDAEGLAWAS